MPEGGRVVRALYEINADLEALLSNVDEETGELLIDPEALDALLMERTDKLEGVALAVKNCAAEAAAIKAEEDALKERRQRLEKKRDGMTRYLEQALAGEKFETARCQITYRKSVAVEIDDAVFFKRPPAAYVKKTVTADKAAIKQALKDGVKIRGAALIERQNMSIK